MKNLIETIKQIGTKEIGTISTNNNGVKYQYITYTVNEPTYEMKKEWYKMAKENSTKSYGGHKVISNSFFIDNNTMYFGYSQFKGGKDGSMGYKELNIIN